VKPPEMPRIGSGRGRWRSGEFVALDFELTGLDPARDAIISFGTVPVSGGRVLLADAIYREVKPSVPPSIGSVKVHGLRSKDLDGAPSLSRVTHELSDALAGRYLLTWVADVEIGFLRTVFGKPWWWWRRRTIDVLDLVRVHAQDRQIVSPPGEAGLSVTAKRYGIPDEDPHHALNDALMTAELFLVLATKLSVLGRPCVRDLVRARRNSDDLTERSGLSVGPR
jgi:DNA polymerase-3 subunit epsilon